ncbi:MAG: hypothetical protein Q9N62_04110 [Ghiorsea sp.]|nr:hypothetical protein [Ghiorsea sp.]
MVLAPKPKNKKKYGKKALFFFLVPPFFSKQDEQTKANTQFIKNFLPKAPQMPLATSEKLLARPVVNLPAWLTLGLKRYLSILL